MARFRFRGRQGLAQNGNGRPSPAGETCLAQRLVGIGQMSIFITFEGIEGSGKTTQIALLASHLEQQGRQVVRTREPGGCDIADQVRAILLDPANAALDSTAELLLYAAARAQHVGEVIRPALESGHLVLCDRYTDATLTYQGCGRGLDSGLIDELNRVAARDVLPHLTILIDLPAETGLGRALAREEAAQDSSEGRFEREQMAFHQRVRQGYLDLARAQSERFVVIDGDQEVAQIAAQIAASVDAFLASGESR